MGNRQGLVRVTLRLFALAVTAGGLACAPGESGDGGGTGMVGINVPPGAVQMQVDSAQRFQTWAGMEVATEFYHRDDNPLRDLNIHPVPQNILDAMLDDAVTSLGVTSLDFANALMMLSGNRPGMEPVNDNGDPFVLDSSMIRWQWFDPYVQAIVLPFKQRVEARGDPFVLNMTAIAWAAYHWKQPAADPGQEYAEFMMACMDRLSQVHGIVPDYVSVYNEPDLASYANETRAEVVRAVALFEARLRTSGYTTQLRFPDVTNANNAASYLDEMASSEPGLLNSLGVISFHGYAGFPVSVLNDLRSRAAALGISTIQSEWWFTGNHPPDLYRALTEANVTQYQPYALNSLSNDSNARGLYNITFTPGVYPLHTYTGFQRRADWYDIYQYSAFIRPGDVRIEVTSSDTFIKPVAFVKPNGRQTLVVINESNSSQQATIDGLPAGNYGVSITSATQQGEEQPQINLSAGFRLPVTLPPTSVTSIYPR